jgi:uncharacterized protein (TIGR02118 family)
VLTLFRTFLPLNQALAAQAGQIYSDSDRLCPSTEVNLNRADCFMLKFVYCVRRLPSLSQQAFRKYWLENHGPLVRKYAETLKARKYIQSHTLDSELNIYAQQPRGTKPAYDGITEMWWDKPEDLIAALGTPEGQQANRLLAEDEARFCDLPNCSVFFTEEHIIFDR